MAEYEMIKYRLGKIAKSLNITTDALYMAIFPDGSGSLATRLGERTIFLFRDLQDFNNKTDKLLLLLDIEKAYLKGRIFILADFLEKNWWEFTLGAI